MSLRPALRDAERCVLARVRAWRRADRAFAAAPPDGAVSPRLEALRAARVALREAVDELEALEAGR